MDIFSKRIKELRNKYNIKQTFLAEIAGTTPQNYNAYEKGREPSFEAVVKLAKYFDVSTDYLLGVSDYATKPLQNISDELEKIFKLYTNDFKELVKLEDFDLLVHYCHSYIKEKGMKMYLYDSDVPKRGKVTGVIAYEKINQSHIRRTLEFMAYQYYEVCGLPKDREVVFDTDSFDDWDFMVQYNDMLNRKKTIAENAKGGKGNNGD